MSEEIVLIAMTLSPAVTAWIDRHFSKEQKWEFGKKGNTRLFGLQVAAQVIRCGCGIDDEAIAFAPPGAVSSCEAFGTNPADAARYHGLGSVVQLLKGASKRKHTDQDTGIWQIAAQAIEERYCDGSGTELQCVWAALGLFGKLAVAEVMGMGDKGADAIATLLKHICADHTGDEEGAAKAVVGALGKTTVDVVYVASISEFVTLVDNFVVRVGPERAQGVFGQAVVSHALSKIYDEDKNEASGSVRAKVKALVLEKSLAQTAPLVGFGLLGKIYDEDKNEASGSVRAKVKGESVCAGGDEPGSGTGGTGRKSARACAWIARVAGEGLHTCALELTATQKLELLIQGGCGLLRQALFSRLPQTLAACTAVVQ
jgi:hypothetical protein